MISGNVCYEKASIYAITHNVTGRTYIGSTTRNVYARYKAHMKNLRGKRHNSKKMQEDFEQFGEDFSFCVLSVIDDFRIQHPFKKGCSMSNRLFNEYLTMNKFNTIDSDFGYNEHDRMANWFINKLKER